MTIENLTGLPDLKEVEVFLFSIGENSKALAVEMSRMEIEIAVLKLEDMMRNRDQWKAADLLHQSCLETAKRSLIKLSSMLQSGAGVDDLHGEINWALKDISR